MNELRESTAQVEKLNQQLEYRVADQVGEIERMSRLRRFLPPQVADLIVASGSEKQLESHRREITALFCDLRGFTGFTESADAEDVMELLRDYHAAIGEIIIKYNGTLERQAGDGVMHSRFPATPPACRMRSAEDRIGGKHRRPYDCTGQGGMPLSVFGMIDSVMALRCSGALWQVAGGSLAGVVRRARII